MRQHEYVNEVTDLDTTFLCIFGMRAGFGKVPTRNSLFFLGNQAQVIEGWTALSIR